LRNPALFMPVMPPWIPLHRFCIIASGMFELLGGLGLLIPERRVQFATGWGLTLLLIAVFPANIYMAFWPEKIPDMHYPHWALWARLPLQIAFIAWVWFAAGLRRIKT